MAHPGKPVDGDSPNGPRSVSERASILRVRPASAIEEGPPAERLDELLRATHGDAVQVVRKLNFTIPLDASPYDEPIVARLRDTVVEALHDANVLLIDFCHPRIVAGYAVPEWILYRALAEAVVRVSDQARIIIYLETLPGRGEKLLGLVPVDRPAEQIQFIDEDGHTLGTDLEAGPTADRLAHFFSGRTQVLAQSIRGRLIRWRGVFRRPSRPHDRFFKYQYSLHGDVAYQELGELISEYLISINAATVVFSDYAFPGWLEPAVTEAAQRLGLPWASLATLAEPEGSIDAALLRPVEDTRALLADAGTTVAVILPAYKAGLSHIEVERQLSVLGCDRFQLLAVIADQSLVDRNEVEIKTFRSVRVPRGPDSFSVDFLLSAEIESLQSDDWLVKCAGVLGEVQEMSMDIRNYTRVAIWSLLADYPAGLERPVPGGRLPIRWYPSLADLHPWDAHWIAWLLVQQICERLNCTSNMLLLVVPSEGNASRRLAVEAERVEGVRVVSLSRSEIDGRVALSESAQTSIRDYEHLLVAAVDEASISGGTLTQISQRVQDVRGRGCDTSATMLNARIGEAPEVSLFDWAPYVMEVAE